MQLGEAREGYVRWITVTKDLSPHTIRAYASDISALEQHLGEQTLVSRLTNARLVAFIEEQRAEGLSSASIRRRISGLRGFCKWLMYQGLLQTDPSAGASIALARGRKLPRVLSDHDLARLLRSLRVAARADDLDPEDPERVFQRTTLLAVALMVMTGARVSEVVSIKCCDIDLTGGSIRILGKGRRERQIFLTSDWIRKLVSAYLETRAALAVEHSHLLFNVRLEPLTPSAVRARLAKVSQSILETKLTPHTLRHTAATQLIEAGVDIRFIQRLLGHASLTTTEIYTHVSDGALRKALSDADVLGRFVTRDN